MYFVTPIRPDKTWNIIAHLARGNTFETLYSISVRDSKCFAWNQKLISMMEVIKQNETHQKNWAAQLEFPLILCEYQTDDCTWGRTVISSTICVIGVINL